MEPLLNFRLDPGEWADLARDVRSLADNLPKERTAVLQGMRETVRSAVLDQYYSYPAGSGRRLPPAFSGTWGTGLRVTARFDRINVSNDTSYARAVESGRGPGPVSKSVIEAWAEEKLGVDEPRVVRAIWSKIKRHGYAGSHIIERATSPYAADGVGPELHAELGRILRDRIDRIIRQYGWGKV